MMKICECCKLKTRVNKETGVCRPCARNTILVQWKTVTDTDWKSGVEYSITTADFKCPHCKKLIHVYKGHSPDMPGNRYPSDHQSIFEIPCGHTVRFSQAVDIEHRPVSFSI